MQRHGAAGAGPHPGRTAGLVRVAADRRHAAGRRAAAAGVSDQRMVSSAAAVSAADAVAPQSDARPAGAGDRADPLALRLGAALRLLWSGRGLPHPAVRAAGVNRRPAAAADRAADRRAAEYPLDRLPLGAGSGRRAADYRLPAQRADHQRLGAPELLDAANVAGVRAADGDPADSDERHQRGGAAGRPLRLGDV